MRIHITVCIKQRIAFHSSDLQADWKVVNYSICADINRDILIGLKGVKPAEGSDTGPQT